MLKTCYELELPQFMFTAKVGRVLVWFEYSLTSQSTNFQSFWEGANASWVLTSTMGSLVKCLLQGHFIVEVDLSLRNNVFYHLAIELPLSNNKSSVQKLLDYIGVFTW